MPTVCKPASIVRTAVQLFVVHHVPRRFLRILTHCIALVTNGGRVQLAKGRSGVLNPGPSGPRPWVPPRDYLK